jgi:hypothetical protein
MNQNNQGYLYIAIGSKYIEEASISAKSLRRVDPNARITLVTDQAIQEDVFDNVIIHPDTVTNWREGLSYKVRHIYESSPYEKTFFVDSDTYFYESCTELFDLLDYFELCMALAHGDSHAASVNNKRLSACHPYNTGIILYKKNAKNDALFKTWQSLYDTKLKENQLTGKESDQTAFMEALLQSDSRVYVLPDIWNARTPCYLSLYGTVKVVHGRHSDYEKLLSTINITARGRGWNPSRKKCEYYHEPKVITQIKELIKDRIPTIRKVYQKFFVTFEKRSIKTH